MPFIIGASIVGGILILWSALTQESDEEKATKAKNSSPSGEKFDVDRMRTLRRELKHQMRLKKKIIPNDGEPE